MESEEDQGNQDKSGESGKSGKSGRSGKNDKPGKSGRSGKTGKSGNSDKSGESRGPRGGLFVDLFTDAGFKYALGRPESKQSLIHFLNTFLDKINIRIRDIEYQNTEQLAEIALGRHSNFAIYCITDEGDHIIIEMQSQYQPNYPLRPDESV